MASTDNLTIENILAVLRKEDLRSLVRYVVSRNLRTSDCNAIHTVAVCLLGFSDRIKMAILYLEWVQWDIQEALFQIELDTADREDSWMVVENDGYPALNQSYNIDFKRTLAKGGDDFDEGMFDITYKTDATQILTRSFPDEAKENFDQNNRHAVDDLNRWRRSMMWHLIGPEMGLAHSQSEKWHPLQETYVRNRFALPTATKVDFKGIHQDYLAVFQGVLLPGRAKPSGHRSQTAITSYLHREIIDRHDGVLVSKSLTRDIKHDLAKSRLQQEWKTKLAAAKEGRGKPIYQDRDQ